MEKLKQNCVSPGGIKIKYIIINLIAVSLENLNDQQSYFVGNK